MKIYIEVIILFIILMIVLGSILWSRISKRRLLKKYDPKNDKSREGGKANLGPSPDGERAAETTTVDSSGDEQPGEDELLPAPEDSPSGKDSNSDGESRRGSKIRAILSKRK